MHPCLIDGNVSFQSDERKFIQFLLGENIFPTDKPPPLIYDEREVESWDESRSYIFSMIDIVKRWSLASVQQLQGLKTIMVTFMLIPNLTKKQPFNFQVVVLSDISVEDAIKFNDCCRNQQIAFMLRFVSDVKSEEVHSIKKGNCEAIEKHHASIIEWNDKLGSHLQQLAIANRNVGVLMVVLQAEGSKKKMENADQRGTRVLIDVLGHETLNQSSLRTRMFSSRREIRRWKEDDNKVEMCQVGDVVAMEMNYYFPTDLHMLLASYDVGICYRETTRLDGSSSTVGILQKSCSSLINMGCSHFIKQQMLVILKGSQKRVNSLKLKRLIAFNHIEMGKFIDLLPANHLVMGLQSSLKCKTFSISICKETRLWSHLIICVAASTSICDHPWIATVRKCKVEELHKFPKFGGQQKSANRSVVHFIFL